MYLIVNEVYNNILLTLYDYHFDIFEYDFTSTWKSNVNNSVFGVQQLLPIFK